MADSSINEFAPCKDYILLVSCNDSEAAQDGVQCVIKLAQEESPSSIKVSPRTETGSVIVKINFNQKSEKQIDKLHEQLKKCTLVKSIKILTTNNPTSP